MRSFLCLLAPFRELVKCETLPPPIYKGCVDDAYLMSPSSLPAKFNLSGAWDARFVTGEETVGCTCNCVGSFNALTLSRPAFMMSEEGSRLRLNSLLLERSFLLSLLSHRALSSRPALTLGCGEIATRLKFACYVYSIG